MAEKEKARGKVIQFTPRQRQRPKLKKLDYIDPVQRQLRKERGRQRNNSKVRSSVIRNVGIFVGLCVLVYMITNYL